MSSICGIYRLDGSPVDRDRLERMAGSAPAPGRHEADVWIEGPVGLARQVPAGAALAERRRGLRRTPGPQAALVAGTDLTPSDGIPTEADRVLAAYRRWGEAYPEHLPEPWATAVWDGLRRRLLLTRDRVGERPLYWCRAPGEVLFATDPVQLLASGALPAEPHRRRVLAHLLGAEADPEWSYFEGISRLPEGCFLLADERGGVEVRRYWDWRAVPVAKRSREETAHELRRRLERAVERRLAAQGETGVLLSGGLDSSAVAAVAADRLAARGRTLHALTWTSDQADAIDETERSRLLVASRTYIREHPVPADALWPLSRFPETFSDPADPTTNAYPDLLLSTLEAAWRAGCEVVMNGIGADPVVGGLAPELELLRRGRVPTLARRWRAGGWRRSPVLHKLRAGVEPGYPEWLTARARRLAEEAGIERASISWAALASADAWRRRAVATPMNAATLERFDRLGRRTGVRIAAPWHDAEIAELVLSLPGRALSPGPPQKQLLREAMRGHLPAKVLEAPTDKSACSRLLRRGLLEEGRSVVEGLLSATALADLGLVEPAAAVAAYRRHAETGRLMPGLWALLGVAGWLDRRPGAATAEGTGALKKPYGSPVLVAYGGIWELTRQVGNDGFDGFIGSQQTT